VLELIICKINQIKIKKTKKSTDKKHEFYFALLAGVYKSQQPQLYKNSHVTGKYDENRPI
jgi:hypothetical protein